VDLLGVLFALSAFFAILHAIYTIHRRNVDGCRERLTDDGRKAGNSKAKPGKSNGRNSIAIK
jgi:hypothetical protein